jgi:hypothetical protein
MTHVAWGIAGKGFPLTLKELEADSGVVPEAGIRENSHDIAGSNRVVSGPGSL